MYKTLIKYNDNKKIMRKISKHDAQKHGNILRFIGNLSNIDYILVFCESPVKKSNGDKRFYAELVYSRRFEAWKQNNERIERTNKPGYEYYSGYGCMNDGKKNRFYIGKSTGWIPIYIELLRKDSTGGTSLFWKNHLNNFRVV